MLRFGGFSGALCGIFGFCLFGDPRFFLVCRSLFLDRRLVKGIVLTDQMRIFRAAVQRALQFIGRIRCAGQGVRVCSVTICHVDPFFACDRVIYLKVAVGITTDVRAEVFFLFGPAYSVGKAAECAFGSGTGRLRCRSEQTAKRSAQCTAHCAACGAKQSCNYGKSRGCPFTCRHVKPIRVV